jgi:hypothetical protein
VQLCWLVWQMPSTTLENGEPAEGHVDTARLLLARLDNQPLLTTPEPERKGKRSAS